MASPRKQKTAPNEAADATVQNASTGPVVTLAQVIEATRAGNFVYTANAFYEPLVASGDVEINSEMTDAEGRVATRATEKALNVTTATETQKAAKPSFEIESNVAIPDRKKREFAAGNRAGAPAKYPFDSLEVGQSFFVADSTDEKTGEVKKAAKSMASTVAAANARYAKEVEGETRVNRKGRTVPVTTQERQFKVFDTVKDATQEVSETNPMGARVFRIQPDGVQAD